MAAVDLPPPAIADFDLAVASRSSVADHEMVSEAVLHPTNVPVVIIECRRVSLTRTAVVHDDKLPATARDRRAIDLRTHRARQITITCAATAPPTDSKQARPKSARLFVTIFLDC